MYHRGKREKGKERILGLELKVFKVLVKDTSYIIGEAKDHWLLSFFFLCNYIMHVETK